MSNHSEKFYDRLSFVYPVIDVFLMPQKYQLFNKINSHPRGRLLEIGVGNGAHFKYYKKHDVVGIDTSRSMLARAGKQLKENIQLFHMNGEDLLFSDGSFDYVVLSHVVAVVNDPEKLMREVHRVLKPHGKVFLLNHFTPDNWMKYIDRFFERISMRFHFRSVFHVSGLSEMAGFRLLAELNTGPLSYFKILIYEKSL